MMTRLHLDTDLGGDIDDLCALVMVLNWPGAELIAVTTNSDDGGRRAGYTRYALELAGRPDIPVAAGADVALGCYRVRPGLPDEAAYWPEPIPAAPGPLEQALDLLERSIEQAATIVAIGAYTNLALLERRSPGILRRANLVLMGGHVYPPRAGFPPWNHEADWNMQIDVESAFTVLRCADPLLVPLAVTVETALRRSHLPALKKAGPLARLIARQAEAFARDEGYEAKYGRTCPGLPADIINFLHDPLACAVALGWKGVKTERLPLLSAVEDGWLRQRIQEDGQPTRVVTAVDGGRFSELWLDVVCKASLSSPYIVSGHATSSSAVR
ncbi:MAG: nucleoside hydrolase [Anaerolineae bacterium]